VGTDTFSYLAHDTRGATDAATATITVAQALTRHGVADFDGNATTDLSVYRPSNGAWYVNGGNSGFWGADGDVPLPLPNAIRRFFA